MDDTMTTQATETPKTYTKTDRHGQETLFVVGEKTGRHYRVRVRTVGQRFGCVGALMSGRTCVAEGDVRPFGFSSSAENDAIELARTR